MPRAADEKARNARKYGRRHAVLAASKNAAAFTAIARRLLMDLQRAGAAAGKVQALRDGLRTASDVTRRGAAVWAIVAELEAIEAAPPRAARSGDGAKRRASARRPTA